MHGDDFGSVTVRDSFSPVSGSGGRHVWILLYLCVCLHAQVVSVLVLVTLHVQGQVVGA